MMEDFNSETDSDYTSYWRDWVSNLALLFHPFLRLIRNGHGWRRAMTYTPTFDLVGSALADFWTYSMQAECNEVDFRHLQSHEQRTPWLEFFGNSFALELLADIVLFVGLLDLWLPSRASEFWPETSTVMADERLSTEWMDFSYDEAPALINFGYIKHFRSKKQPYPNQVRTIFCALATT